MFNIGIMQGRLVEPKGRGIQFFPFEEWEREFVIASKLGLCEIEWIFDFEQYEKNPLWTSEGCKTIVDNIRETNVTINSVCFDYFMRRPFFKYENNERDAVYQENIRICSQVLENMNRIGANLLEIPLVDASSIQSEEEKKLVIFFLRKIIKISQQHKIELGVETDLPVPEFRDFIERVDCNYLKANYDSGNSSGLGYNHEDELLSLGDYVGNVHIKDRILGGATQALGLGSADFDAVFSSLKKINYGKSFILQAARSEDGEEEKNIKEQMEFVHKYFEKYGIQA